MTESNKCSNPDCDFGWVTFKYFDEKSVKLRTGEIRVVKTEYQGAQPCPVCDPTRAEIFATSQTQEELQTNLMNRSSHKRLEAYKKAEDSKTKVL